MSRDAVMDDSADRLGEMAGQMHALLELFQQQLTEMLVQQRLSVQEQRTDGAKALEYLKGIGEQASGVQTAHQSLVKLIEREWPERLDEGARRAGAIQAEAIGTKLAGGLQATLTAAGDHATRAASRIEYATHRLQWKFGAIVVGSIVALAALIVFALALWSAQVRADVQSLRTEAAELTHSIETLKRAGGELDLAHCAPGDTRLCIRIDTQERFGPRKDYAPVRYQNSP